MTLRLVHIVGLVLIGSSIAWGVGAGVDPDTDYDGIWDPFDNCVLVPNGPLESTGSCSSMEDGDLDGYGNPCDGDVNNNGVVGLPDVGLMLNALGSSDATADLNCNGVVGLPDVGMALLALGQEPGPSGLYCAGVGPYPCVAE